MGREEHERAVRFRTARRDPALTVVEGFHALKHALRFGAELVEAVAVDPPALEAMAARAGARPGRALRRPRPGGRQGDPRRPGAAGPAHPRRRDRPPAAGRPRRGSGRPGTGAGGAARAAAQHGQHRRLHPGRGRGRGGGADRQRRERPLAPRRGARRRRAAVRAPGRPGRGLPASDRPLLAIDPEGEELAPGVVRRAAILAFGTERHGLSSEVFERAEARVSIPMREGVSSLNLGHLGCNRRFLQ